MRGGDVDARRGSRRRSGTGRTAAPISAPAASSSCAIRTAAGSMPRSIACRSIRAKQGHDPVRPSRPPRRHHRQEILGPRHALPGRGGERRGPGAVHRGLRVSAGGRVGIRLRRRHQGRADRDHIPGPVTGLPLPAHAEIILEGHLLADRRDLAAGRPVRRIHRLFRRRHAAVPGDGGDRDPSSRAIRSCSARRR